MIRPWFPWKSASTNRRADGSSPARRAARRETPRRFRQTELATRGAAAAIAFCRSILSIATPNFRREGIRIPQGASQCKPHAKANNGITAAEWADAALQAARLHRETGGSCDGIAQRPCREGMESLDLPEAGADIPSLQPREKLVLDRPLALQSSQ